MEKNNSIGTAYFLFAFFTYHISVIALVLLNEDVTISSLFSIEVVFIYVLFLLQAYNVIKLNNIILFNTVPLLVTVTFLVNNYRLVQFDTNPKTSELKSISGELYLWNYCKFTRKSNNMRRGEVELALALANASEFNYCDIKNQINSINIKLNNKIISFTAGNNYYKKLIYKPRNSYEYSTDSEYKSAISNWSVKYTEQYINKPYISVLYSIVAKKQQQRIVYEVSHYEQIVDNFDYFIEKYRKQNERYILFSILFILDAILFLFIFRLIYKRYFLIGD